MILMSCKLTPSFQAKTKLQKSILYCNIDQVPLNFYLAATKLFHRSPSPGPLDYLGVPISATQPRHCHLSTNYFLPSSQSSPLVCPVTFLPCSYGDLPQAVSHCHTHSCTTQEASAPSPQPIPESPLFSSRLITEASEQYPSLWFSS